jgi:hypothetical protein
MGEQLKYHGFTAFVNPCGIIYNPVSIAQNLELAASKQSSDETIFDQDNFYFSWDVHSDLTRSSRPETVEAIRQARKNLWSHLQQATHLFVTLGTAWVYELKENGKIVANCHKQPGSMFKKRLLSIEEICEALKQTVKAAKQGNDKVNVIFTLSPVRHIRDGFVENMRSKSLLHTGIQEVVQQMGSTYFPSYELVMDEMRDYRFYGEDMLHLNQIGIAYVWERFRESAIHPSADQMMKAVKGYRKFSSHRPRSNEKEHLLQVENRRAELMATYPHLIDVLNQ